MRAELRSLSERIAQFMNQPTGRLAQGGPPGREALERSVPNLLAHYFYLCETTVVRQAIETARTSALSGGHSSRYWCQQDSVFAPDRNYVSCLAVRAHPKRPTGELYHFRERRHVWRRSHVTPPLQTDAVLHDAAIGENGGGREIARAISGDKADDAGNLLRPRHAPQRYRGISCASFFGSCMVARLIGVATAPGATPTTRMLCLASSTPAVRVSMRMPPLGRQ
jgi:hypothetical protein